MIPKMINNDLTQKILAGILGAIVGVILAFLISCASYPVHVPGNCVAEAKTIQKSLKVESRVLKYISYYTKPAHVVVIYHEGRSWYMEDYIQGRRWIGNNLSWSQSPLTFARIVDGTAMGAVWEER